MSETWRARHDHGLRAVCLPVSADPEKLSVYGYHIPRAVWKLTWELVPEPEPPPLEELLEKAAKEFDRQKEEIEQLQQVIHCCFSVDRSHESADLDVIGMSMYPMPDDVRATILKVLETAETVGGE